MAYESFHTRRRTKGSLGANSLAFKEHVIVLQIAHIFIIFIIELFISYNLLIVSLKVIEPSKNFKRIGFI